MTTPESARLAQLESVCDRYNEGCLYLSIFKVASVIHHNISLPDVTDVISSDELMERLTPYCSIKNTCDLTYNVITTIARNLNLSLTRISLFEKGERQFVPQDLQTLIHTPDEALDRIIPSVILFRKQGNRRLLFHAEAATISENDLMRIYNKIKNGWKVTAVISFT